MSSPPPPIQVSSLSQHKIEIAHDTRIHLENQLLDLYHHDSSIYENENDSTNPTSISTTYGTVPSHVRTKAQQHLNGILESMKSSPKTTICRVNLIVTTREALIHELEHILDPWKHQRLSMLQSLQTIHNHDQNDLPSPPFDNWEDIDLKIVPHPILHDCIEIKWWNTKTDAIAKGLVLPRTSYYHPPPSTSQINFIINPNEIKIQDTTNPITPQHNFSSVTPTATTTTTTTTTTMAIDRLSSMTFEKRKHRKALGWPDTHRVIICDRICGEAVLRGSDIFCRGILCADSGIRAGEQVAVYADLNKKGSTISRGILLEQYKGPCLFLGTGVAQCKRAEMFHLQYGMGVNMSHGLRASPSDLPPLNGILADKMMLQNLPSVLVAATLEPKPGETILDMCCAPGGKTSHLASLLHNDALIVACDKSRKKMLAVRETMKRNGATCVIPLALDSTHIVVNNNEGWKSVQEIISTATPSAKGDFLNIKAFHPESFDRILLDPPCSALGLRPKLDIQTTTNELIKHANYQKKFIHKAVALLKPGGTMTYSTCTFNANENEDMIRYTLESFPCMKLVPIERLKIGLPGLPGRGLDKEQCQMVCRFDPSGVEDTMGFFVAKFIKTASNVIT